MFAAVLLPNFRLQAALRFREELREKPVAISDEDAGKVQSFIEQYKFSYPILLDPGRKVNEQFVIEGIPKSFVYDRDGKLVAQAIDMRTKRQFLEMLSDAGLK